MQKVNQKVNEIFKQNEAGEIPIVPLVPLRMSAPPPYPPPPSNLPTADELHLGKQTKRLEESEKLKNSALDGFETMKGQGKSAQERAKGMWGLVANSVKRGVVEIQSGATSTARGATVHRDQQRYLSLFGYLAEQGAQFHSAHQGSVMHQGIATPMSIFLTSTHMCFIGSGVKDAIPYTNVVSVVPGVCLSTIDLVPYIITLPRADVVPTSVDFYVKVHTPSGAAPEFLKYQILNFTEDSVTHLVDVALRPAVKFIAEVDRTWRSLVRVPVEGLQYAVAGSTSDAAAPAAAPTPAAAAVAPSASSPVKEDPPMPEGDM